MQSSTCPPGRFRGDATIRPMNEVNAGLGRQFVTEETGAEGAGRIRWLRLVTGLAVLLVVLTLTRFYSYNLFHSLAELFSVAVALAVFAIAWHTRSFARNPFLLFLGFALALVAITDTLHLLAYKGMGVFSDTGSDLPTQLWVAGRYEFALAFLLAPLLVPPRRRLLVPAFGILAVVWIALLLSIFAWPGFPHALVEEQGLTVFKKASEYAVCVALIAAFVLLYRKRAAFERRIFLLLGGAVAATILSELSFTLYVDPYGALNLVGHYLKIVAFFLLYMAIVDRTLVVPYSLLFRDLRQRDEERDQLLARLDGVGQVTEAAMQSLEVHELIDSVLARLLPLVGAQAGLILLAQGDRLAAVSGLGFGRELREDFTVAIGEGIAGRVAATGRPLFVQDVQEDPRVTSPIVRGGDIQSVLAVPLRRGGALVGVMHVDWTERKRLTPGDLSFVELLADRVAVALFNADLYSHQKEVAEVLQQEMLSLPSRLPGVEFGHVYRSASKGAHVGGDFYDVFSGEDARVWILIGDVSGHGVEAATTALLIREITRAFLPENGEPAQVLRKVNHAIVRRLAFRHYATMFLGALDVETGHLEYCSAGHPPGLIRRLDGTLLELTSRSLPIGAFADAVYKPARASLLGGETLLLYTDGVTEARHGAEFFGEKPVMEVLRGGTTAERLPRELLDRVQEFTGGQLIDDLAILCISR
jgi:hypothetical protein